MVNLLIASTANACEYPAIQGTQRWTGTDRLRAKAGSWKAPLSLVFDMSTAALVVAVSLSAALISLPPRFSTVLDLARCYPKRLCGSTVTEVGPG